MNVDLSFNFLIWTHFLNQSRLLNLYLSHFSESVLVLVLPKSKSLIPSFHTPFWDKGVDKIDSEINYEIWKLDGVKYLIKIIHVWKYT